MKLQSLRSKVTVAIAIFFVFVAAINVTTLTFLKNMEHNAEMLEHDALRFSGDVMDLTVVLKNSRFDAVEVQQWLTDVSASRGADGLDEGYKLAEKYAKKFDEYSQKAHDLAVRQGYDKLAGEINLVRDRFVPFYALGKEMADVYVAEGPKAGNKLMKAFHKSGEDLEAAFDAALATHFARLTEERENLQVEAEHYESSAHATDLMTYVSMGVTIVATLIAGFAILHFVVSPMTAIAKAVSRISDGDYTVELGGATRGDEIGDISKAVHILRDTAAEREEIAAKQAEEDRQRDIRVQKREELVNSFRGHVAELMSSVNRTMDNLNTTAGSLTAVASGTATEADGAAEATNTALANVEAVAAAAEELSASIDEISRRVSSTLDVVTSAARTTEETTTKVSTLSSAAQEIDEVVQLISNIADQTNLLALNATIEAARAGEAGKGFAVVASEVKALANQTAKATESITQQIASIQGATTDAAGSIERIAKIMDEVSGETEAIAAAVTEQSAATSEISRGVHAAASGTQTANQNVLNVAENARKSTQSASEVDSAVGIVSKSTGDLSEEIERFIKDFAA
ncbi:methyl-accepting chemotaxis protein [Roseibium sp.]|uniref:methyl-accepting chemotaxis protein n=1 Tax=Roseibium sp. TaxID=1936156 RepID=UPI003A973F96